MTKHTTANLAVFAKFHSGADPELLTLANDYANACYLGRLRYNQKHSAERESIATLEIHVWTETRGDKGEWKFGEFLEVM